MQTKLDRILGRVIALMLALLLLVPLLPAPVRAAGISGRNLVIVSMGDSYSAGEGIEDFYHQKPTDKKALSSYTPTEDWLAHRSEHAWGGMLNLRGWPMADYRYDPLEPKDNVHWFFVASSGAVCADIQNQQAKKYTFSKKESVTTVKLPAQIEVFDTLDDMGLRADYITMTMGGNDVEFEKVIKEAAAAVDFLMIHRKTDLCVDLAQKIGNFDSKYGPRLEQAYKDILDRAGSQAHLIIAGYPLLFTDAEKTFSPFNKDARDAVNLAVGTFNDKIEALIGNLAKQPEYLDRISFVSVEDAFKNHGAYSKDAYINSVDLTAEYQDREPGEVSAYSMHPNIKGAQAYAKCVQDEIDRLEENRGIFLFPGETSFISADNIPICRIGNADAPYRYYEVYADRDTYCETVAGLELYWDENYDYIGPPHAVTCGGSNSVLLSFQMERYGVAAIFDGWSERWTVLPEHDYWTCADQYYIGQALSMDPRNTSRDTYLYDLQGNLFKEMHNVGYGAVSGHEFLYGNVDDYYRLSDPDAPDATFDCDVYAIDLLTGSERYVCTYTMYCSAMYSTYFKMTPSGLSITSWEDGQEHIYDLNSAVIPIR